MYALLRPLLFKLNPEAAHYLAIKALKLANKTGVMAKLIKDTFQIEDTQLERQVFGLTFKNPIGLAAGFDKNAECVDELASLGFGFIEVGTVTPLPQPGNEKPRLFRLLQQKALINRMGFNNYGAQVVGERLRRLKKNKLLIGVNIGRNKHTPNEEAVKDYVSCFESLDDVADYFVVNISSPNTPDLRLLQEKESLKKILEALQERNHRRVIPRPMLLKIAPDLSKKQLDDIITVAKHMEIAGVVATNTTLSRQEIPNSACNRNEPGGLSGGPLKHMSNEVIRYVAERCEGKLSIIGSGGILSAHDAQEKLAAGASLLQLYTGLIYEGPGLVKQICNHLLKQG